MTHARHHLTLLLLLAFACQTPPATPLATQTVPPSPRPSATPASGTSPAPTRLTPTLAPAPRVFIEEFEDGVPFWRFMQSGEDTDALETDAGRGFLWMHLAAPNLLAYAVYDAHTYADVRVDAQMEFDPGGQGAAGLICRYDPATGWYEFNIYADQTYTLLFGQWLADGVARYTPLVVSDSEEILQDVNQIALACQGDVLTPYINGIQLRKRQERQHVLTEGKIGLAAASFEGAPLVITYDWVGVGAP